MKISTGIAIAAAIVATATTLPAQAAKKGNTLAQHETSCKAQAAKKFSAIHFLKRRDFVNNCMSRTAQNKAAHHKVMATKKAEPTTTGQSVK